jgi:hypothetical protein
MCTIGNRLLYKVGAINLGKWPPTLEIELERELDDARIYTRAANDTESWGSEIIVGISELRVI